jgi:hypothetical protein
MGDKENANNPLDGITVVTETVSHLSRHARAAVVLESNPVPSTILTWRQLQPIAGIGAPITSLPYGFQCR